MHIKAVENSRVIELDGLRGIAVVMVLAWHFIGSMSPADGTLLSDLPVFLTMWGRTGVDLFFVLSGFLIIGVLIDHRGSGNLFHVFYIRRALRIYPPYLALIAAYWACYAWIGESPAFNTDTGIVSQLVAQLSFTWNWLMATTNSPVARAFSVTWSVAIEEWFYLLFPVIIVWAPKNRLPHLLIAISLTSAIGRAVLYFALPDLPLAPYVLMPFRLDGLCIGGLLALAFRNEAFRAWSHHRATVILRAGLCFFISLPVVVSLIRPALDAHMYLWGHLYLSCGFAIVILAALTGGGAVLGRILRARISREAGRYSYTLYLFHPLFISLFFTSRGRPELVADWTDALLTLVALVASICFSVGFYWCVERQAISRGHSQQYESGRALLTALDGKQTKLGLSGGSAI